MLSSILSELDLSSDINPTDLRDYATNVQDHLKATAVLQNHLIKIECNKARVKALGQLGSLLRRISKLDEARQCFEQAIEVVQSNNLNQKYLLTNSIRLAHTYQWLEKFDLSNALFSEVIKNCLDSSNLKLYLDYAYQHAGKNYFDQKSYELALSYFNKALKIRLKKGNPELVTSTKIAINACNQRIGS